MTRPAPLVAALRLTRPAQWPILTAQLMISMLLAAPVVGAAWSPWLAGLSGVTLAAAWLGWVVLLNGGTLAFNSAYDRDTGPVAYLAQPPEPPTGLAQAALAGMACGALLTTFLVGPFFGALTFFCLVLSVLYSHPRTRWKSVPGLDLLVNMVGYGAGTTLAGILAIKGELPSTSGWWFTAGFGLLFGSFYPLTQIYQTTADRARGDRTLTTALGIRPSLGLALVLAAGAGTALLLGCHTDARSSWAGWLILVMVLWSGHLVWWWVRAKRWDDARHERAMYHALGLWAIVDAAVAVVWLHG